MATTLTPGTLEYAGGTLAREQVGLWRDGLRRLRRNRLALAAVVYLVLLACDLRAVLFWTPYNPNLVATCPDLRPAAARPIRWAATTSVATCSAGSWWAPRSRWRWA